MVARFKGTDSTFSSFPKRLEHVLSKSIDNVVTECVVFPEYEVNRPSYALSYDWLTVSWLGLYRLKENWYTTPNSIQREQSKLKRPSSILSSQAAAVEAFSEWLTKLVIEKEVANGNGGGAGKAKIVLCGHRCVPDFFAYGSVPIGTRKTSMGGILAADALIQFVQNRPDAGAPLWPRIIACLAFDTPV